MSINCQHPFEALLDSRESHLIPIEYLQKGNLGDQRFFYWTQISILPVTCYIVTLTLGSTLNPANPENHDIFAHKFNNMHLINWKIWFIYFTKVNFTEKHGKDVWERQCRLFRILTLGNLFEYHEAPPWKQGLDESWTWPCDTWGCCNYCHPENNSRFIFVDTSTEINISHFIAAPEHRAIWIILGFRAIQASVNAGRLKFDCFSSLSIPIFISRL